MKGAFVPGCGPDTARAKFMAYLPFLKPVIKSFFKKPATQSYPFAPMPKDDLVRGHVEIDAESCIFCGICARKCPTAAIATDKNEKSWTISRFACIVCSACCEACPKKCLFMKKELTPASEVKTVDVAIKNA
ncbi:MAG: 4Fe-4S binding protein [Defluviitaleaceae bacterium]|nr:4Fe-4S binding protein [Defluviitaleaceae bacterium]